MFRVLIVEDDVLIMQRNIAKTVRLALPDVEVETLLASSISEAEQLLSQHGDRLDLVLLDACVPGDTPNTQELARKIKARCNAPMICISTNSEYGKLLVQAGCTEYCHKSRELLLPKLQALRPTLGV